MIIVESNEAWDGAVFVQVENLVTFTFSTISTGSPTGELFSSRYWMRSPWSQIEVCVHADLVLKAEVAVKAVGIVARSPARPTNILNLLRIFTSSCRAWFWIRSALFSSSESRCLPWSSSEAKPNSDLVGDEEGPGPSIPNQIRL